MSGLLHHHFLHGFSVTEPVMPPPPPSGNLQTAVEGLEALYIPTAEAQEDSQPTNISYIFRKVIEEKNEDALDKCKRGTATQPWPCSGLWDTCRQMGVTMTVNDRLSEQLFLLSVSAMAERLANQFASYWPVTSLFLTNVELDRIDEARLQLQVTEWLLLEPQPFSPPLSSSGSGL